MDTQLYDTLVQYGYHPIVQIHSHDAPDGYRQLYESEGWYPGCHVFVPEGEYSETLTRQWYNTED